MLNVLFITFGLIAGACTSFDFCPQDPGMYMIGTEDGTVHKCSCSYNEQFIADFFGHTGPVYSLSWSPMAAGIFLTCSADWTMRIWNQDEEKPLKVLRHSDKSITDCAWSPHSGTVIAAVSSGGLTVWDLSEKELDPIIMLETENLGNSLTTVEFAHNANSIVYGDSEGRVTVAMLCDMKDDGLRGKGSEVEAVRLMGILTKKGPGEEVEETKRT